jgi:hypothetical protein
MGRYGRIRRQRREPRWSCARQRGHGELEVAWLDGDEGAGLAATHDAPDLDVGRPTRSRIRRRQRSREA